ncbi:exo-alpha-sialidase [Jiangella anatolica]|nr:exo-alpha-sialidase [Jiangella anatolica]
MRGHRPRRHYLLPLLAAGVTAAALGATTPAGAEGAAAAIAADDPAMRVVDAWDVTGEHTFPDLGGGVLPAFRPAITEAPNGDLLAGFNTTTDAHPGGQLRLIRSTDDGRTWGASEVLAEPTMFPGGSIHLQRGMTTLRDGTILLPYNDGVNHVRYNNREAALFVARSTDSGHTWAGTDEPVDLPVEFREAWGGGGRILELDDGTLVQTIWGIRELPEDWETDPDPYESGVLLSFDGGETWPEYHRILRDEHSPAYQFGAGELFPGGANETTLEVLPDGTIVAFVRFDISVGGTSGQFYVSRSTDGGRTWSTPLASGLGGSTLSATMAPCSDHLGDGRSKLMLGYRGPGSRAAISVSFDGGSSFQGQIFLRDPRNQASFTSAEPDYHRLDDGRVLTIFQIQSGGGPYRLAANVLEDAPDAASCQAQADAAAARATAQPSFVVERADRDDWFLPMSNLRVSYPATTTVGAVLAAQASRLVCQPGDSLTLTRDGQPLDPAATLAAAGIGNGAVVQLAGTSSSSSLYRIGYTELDIAPEDRSVANWDRACAPGRIAFDYRRRSLGLEVTPPAGQAVTAVELTDEDTASRLTAANYRVLSSPDNEHYTEVDGWSFSSRVEGGRLVHRFDGFAVTDRYLKIAQDRGDGSFSFVLGNARSDIGVEFGPVPCTTTIAGAHDAPLVAGEGVTCVDQAIVAGAVTVAAGGRLVVRDSVIDGPIRAADAAAVLVCDTEVNGPVAVSGTIGATVVGDPANGCAGNQVHGPVALDQNAGPVRFGANTVDGPLSCGANEAPPVDGGTANQIDGSRAGQCGGL